MTQATTRAGMPERSRRVRRAERRAEHEAETEATVDHQHLVLAARAFDDRALDRLR